MKPAEQDSRGGATDTEDHGEVTPPPAKLVFRQEYASLRGLTDHAIWDRVLVIGSDAHSVLLNLDSGDIIRQFEGLVLGVGSNSVALKTLDAKSNKFALVFFRLDSQEPVWRKLLRHPISRNTSHTATDLFLLGYNDKVIVFAISDGTEKYRIPVTPNMRLLMRVTGDVLVLSTVDALSAWDLASSRHLWSLTCTQIFGPEAEAPCIRAVETDAEAVYILGESKLVQRDIIEGSAGFSAAIKTSCETAVGPLPGSHGLVVIEQCADDTPRIRHIDSSGRVQGELSATPKSSCRATGGPLVACLNGDVLELIDPRATAIRATVPMGGRDWYSVSPDGTIVVGSTSSGEVAGYVVADGVDE